MRSKITGGNTKYIFSAKVLNKYSVDYFQCEETGFIQTEESYWLDEAYSSAITKLDLGLPYRNEILRERSLELLNRHFDTDGLFLDYAGGYGLFTRLMRDKGFNFYHSDKYCENIFAEYFDLDNIGHNVKFELVTAFEVFEHMSDPLKEIRSIMEFSDNVFFTTELQPGSNLTDVNDWWYFIPETGQHISFHTENSLKYIGQTLGFNFYTDGVSNHLFSKKSNLINPFSKKRDPFLIRKMRKFVSKFDQRKQLQKESLLQKDWNYVKSKLTF